MSTRRRCFRSAVFSFSVLLSTVAANAGDVCISLNPTTLTIVENTRLTCDMVCTQTDDRPCIEFGASGIKLDLNGFSMTGPADPPLLNCSFALGDGIHASNKTDIVIEGPGLVQKFRRHGVALVTTTKSTVKKVTSHHNCFSGVFLAGVTNTLVEEVVSVKNGSASNFRPCGGVCVTNSNQNRIRRSEIAGNGSVFAVGVPDPSSPAIANDFGIGLVGTSAGNFIEENGIGGNINGLFVFPLALGNVIRKNVIVGNPPVQVSVTSGGVVGADIRDFSPPGANRFEENLCITYIGANPSPCLKLPQYAGHQNN